MLVILFSLLASTVAVETPGLVCEWLADNGTLLVKWGAAPSSDYYELGIATSENGQAGLLYSTARLHAELTALMPGTTYWLNMRAHKSGMPSLGPGTWGALGPSVECSTGAAHLSSKAHADTHANAESESSFFLEVLRESEFTSDVDYLMNHDSGDVLGDVTILTATSSSAPWLSGDNFTNSTLTLYCVEVLKVEVPDTVTTEGDDKFADYLSCNNNGNATDPQCECDNIIDRYLSPTTPISPYCKMQSGEECQLPAAMDSCKCTCTASSLSHSKTYVGMMPVYFRQAQPLGRWFSHPKETECTEFEKVGATRADGSQCTWKRRADMRVFRGWEIEANGWNKTEDNRSKDMHVDVAQVHQNLGVFRQTMANSAFRPWACEVGDASIVVV
mmetsp:Transcript_76614/g.135172  ORF Transcript_76614/g.135172 Transcript_76614/m.135172 type:complete len:389 (+) Transcript_76614:100-1266(+)